MTVEGAMAGVEFGGPEHGMPPWVDGGMLPAFTHIDGRNVALVDAGEYRALLALAEAVSDPEGTRAARAIPGGAGGGQQVATAEVSLPLRVRVHGVEAVLIPAAAYDGLAQVGGRAVGSLSRIERDPELRAYIDARIAAQEMNDIRTAAIEHFGADRVPSRSAFSRYATAQRQAARAVTGKRRRR